MKTLFLIFCFVICSECIDKQKTGDLLIIVETPLYVTIKCHLNSHFKDINSYKVDVDVCIDSRCQGYPNLIEQKATATKALATWNSVSISKEDSGSTVMCLEKLRDGRILNKTTQLNWFELFPSASSPFSSESPDTTSIPRPNRLGLTGKIGYGLAAFLVILVAVTLGLHIRNRVVQNSGSPDRTNKVYSLPFLGRRILHFTKKPNSGPSDKAQGGPGSTGFALPPVAGDCNEQASDNYSPYDELSYEPYLYLESSLGTRQGSVPSNIYANLPEHNCC